MWYRIGTVSLTNGSKVVTGSGTAWAANVQAGDAFHAPDGKVYEIDFVSADASLNLVDAYAGATASGQSYKIQPTQGRVRDLAAAVSTFITEYGSIEAALTVLAGNVGLGTSAPTQRLDIRGQALLGTDNYTGRINFGTGSQWFLAAAGTATANASFSLSGWDGTAYRQNITWDSAGNTIKTLTDAVPTLATARQLVMTRVSDTQVRISMRGVDGTTRSTTLTLA